MEARYKNFIKVDSVPFKELFKDQNINFIQVHSNQPCGDDIVGFCGVVRWKDNTLYPLDGDTYYDEMPVVGYKWFEHNGEKCLDILVSDW